jgi:phosphohistidine swiveling domain-containing protein
MHPFIEKFKKHLGKSKPFLFHGPYSPLMFVAWSKAPSEPLDSIYISRERETFAFVSEDAYLGTAKDMFRKYLSGEVSLSQLTHDSEVVYKRGEDFYNAYYQKDLSTLEEKDLIDILKKATEDTTELVDKTIYMETFDLPVAESVVAEDKLNDLRTAWDFAIHHTAFLPFEHRWFKLITEKSLEYSQFVFTDYYFLRPYEDLKKEVGQIISENDKREISYQKAKEEAEHSVIEVKKFLNNKDEFTKKVVEYIQFVMELRDIRKDPIAQSLNLLFKVAQELARRAGITKEKVLPLISGYEYAQGIEWLKSHKEELESRDKGVLFFIQRDSWHCENLDFAEGKKQLELLLNITSKEIKGQIAYKGKVTGKVRIIINPQGVTDFEEGSILVANMTRPDFLYLMKKAGAVVTNEGGITCHAAIVARELKIPTIIGTRTASQILKDGDMVEVDAEKGIVTILN